MERQDKGRKKKRVERVEQKGRQSGMCTKRYKEDGEGVQRGEKLKLRTRKEKAEENLDGGSSWLIIDV